MPPSIWTSADYALVWPRDLLRDELAALLEHPYRPCSAEDVELLLLEAFNSRAPAAEYARLAGPEAWLDIAPPDGTRPTPRQSSRWLSDLLQHLDEVRDFRPPAPLWRVRQALGKQRIEPGPDDPRAAFADLMTQLEGSGYLARDFGHVCVDAEPDEHGQLPHDGADPIDRIRTELQRQLAQTTPALWPPAWDRWDHETFLELIEAFHDLIARPRRRWYHDHNECGAHFNDFDTDAGRRVYRAFVNRLLEQHAMPLRLADHGDDEGRLIRVVDDSRDDLAVRTLSAPVSQGGDRVHHAVERFRARAATTEDKRAAVVALAGVLEERLPIIKASPNLTSKDEADLFNIANNFALRHQDIKQKRDYDPVFLDWMFWWFLAAIEVTNHALARRRMTVP